MVKPRVKCARVSFRKIGGHLVAHLDRLSGHPKLGLPRCESQTRTSVVLRVNLEQKEMETLNTIYYWED